jgi:hypothetical protein
MVWGVISYNWKSPLIILEGIGKKGVIVGDYLQQVLMPVVAPSFRGATDYIGYLEGGED